MQKILDYLDSKYHPNGILVYGSYANGSNNPYSDFDVMLTYDGTKLIHDDSVINDVQLDAYIYPIAMIRNDIEVSEYVRIYNGWIIKDETGLLSSLLIKVSAYIDSLPRKNREENLQNISWCKKMLQRIQYGNSEGLYRMHWLVVDSLEIYFDILGLYYPGPKNALHELQNTYPNAYDIYCEAMKDSSLDNLNRWVQLLEDSVKP